MFFLVTQTIVCDNIKFELKLVFLNKTEKDKIMSENEIEKEIQKKGLTAPRLTPSDIDSVIRNKTFTKLPSGKAMICELTLKNGFTVRGESACVRPENFDQEIGEKISLENARQKIWQLEGYLLQEKHPII